MIRILYALAPGLGQLLNGRYVIGTLVAAAALGTVLFAEVSNEQYRRLSTEYRRLNLPQSLHAAIAADRRRSLTLLGVLYLVLGVASAAIYRADPAEDHEPLPEDPAP